MVKGNALTNHDTFNEPFLPPLIYPILQPVILETKPILGGCRVVGNICIGAGN